MMMNPSPDSREVILVLPAPNSPAEDRAVAAVHDSLCGQDVELAPTDPAWDIATHLAEQVPGVRIVLAMPTGGTIWRDAHYAAHVGGA
jgi:hypothetical protein